MMNAFSFRQWLVVALILIGLPLSGVFLIGAEVRPYLQFPPLTNYIEHAGFSLPVFIVFAAINFLIILGLGYLLKNAYSKTRPAIRTDITNFPAWGWLGVLIMLGGWFLAWTRFDWFTSFQPHTFMLPWIGYILVVNALCQKRSKKSLLTDAPEKFWLLFLGSAIFWWFFEYLNRFVQNWYYVKVDQFGPLTYAAYASLAFSTVLPAVLSTYRLLLTYKTFGIGLMANRPFKMPRPKLAAGSALILSAIGLALLGVYPDYLYALVWSAPLLIISALQQLSGHRTIFAPLSKGDWRPVAGTAIAALICGFFWEMWNIGSLARWKYTVPYVDRFHIFEMPLLGYGGYLPFGLECLVIGRMITGDRLLSVE
jgi:hypothetical protein